ncbi:hypothetical protein ACIBG8_05100 [Nonomuraea sp. NPDC050556]|uniref:hypothetical protein n=1 Tax=Nonomuraea sp. NPDC050556 TaxID=3364369 RepID=UPI0037BA9A0D
MNEEEEVLAAQEEAAVVAAAMAEAAAEVADPANQQEWIRQSSLIYSGLMAVGLVMVQPFLTVDSLDVSAYVCVIGFAVSTPLLAALLLVNRQEEFRRRTTPSRIVQITKGIAQGSAFVGVVAAFWHITWIAGVVLLVGAVLGIAAQSAGYVRLDYDANFRRRKEPGGP